MSRARHVIHALLGASSILVIGFLAGLSTDRAILHQDASRGDALQGAQAVDTRQETFLTDLQADLGLSVHQANRVQEILRRHQQAVDQAWLDMNLRLETAVDSVAADIEGVLSPEQKDRLHGWLWARTGASASGRGGIG